MPKKMTNTGLLAEVLISFLASGLGPCTCAHVIMPLLFKTLSLAEPMNMSTHLATKKVGFQKAANTRFQMSAQKRRSSWIAKEAAYSFLLPSHMAQPPRHTYTPQEWQDWFHQIPAGGGHGPYSKEAWRQWLVSMDLLPDGPPVDDGPPVNDGPPPADDGPPVNDGPPPVNDGPPPVNDGPPPVNDEPPPVNDEPLVNDGPPLILPSAGAGSTAPPEPVGETAGFCPRCEWHVSAHDAACTRGVCVTCQGPLEEIMVKTRRNEPRRVRFSEELHPTDAALPPLPPPPTSAPPPLPSRRVHLNLHAAIPQRHPTKAAPPQPPLPSHQPGGQAQPLPAADSTAPSHASSDGEDSPTIQSAGCRYHCPRCRVTFPKWSSCYKHIQSSLTCRYHLAGQPGLIPWVKLHIQTDSANMVVPPCWDPEGLETLRKRCLIPEALPRQYQ